MGDQVFRKDWKTKLRWDNSRVASKEYSKSLNPKPETTITFLGKRFTHLWPRKMWTNRRSSLTLHNHVPEDVIRQRQKTFGDRNFHNATINSPATFWWETSMKSHRMDHCLCWDIGYKMVVRCWDIAEKDLDDQCKSTKVWKRVVLFYKFTVLRILESSSYTLCVRVVCNGI